MEDQGVSFLHIRHMSSGCGGSAITGVGVVCPYLLFRTGGGIVWGVLLPMASMGSTPTPMHVTLGNCVIDRPLTLQEEGKTIQIPRAVLSHHLRGRAAESNEAASPLWVLLQMVMPPGTRPGCLLRPCGPLGLSSTTQVVSTEFGEV